MYIIETKTCTWSVERNLLCFKPMCENFTNHFTFICENLENRRKININRTVKCQFINVFICGKSVLARTRVDLAQRSYATNCSLALLGYESMIIQIVNCIRQNINWNQNMIIFTTLSSIHMKLSNKNNNKLLLYSRMFMHGHLSSYTELPIPKYDYFHCIEFYSHDIF